MSRPTFLAPERPEHAMTLLRMVGAIFIIASGVFLGIFAFSEFDHWWRPHEYMPAPDADYAE